ncbi:hypothetical protein BJF85_15410 [Saccharomonospora sp. CUA-673]|nr:hypothetical protein [Saccharomonospora sp. CUA-673]OLT47563.1 hypothetical protein BJF85_15410 [Saccharomonospora sp. CUA-673]
MRLLGPAIGLGPLGPFQDPGAAGRLEAEQILEAARNAVSVGGGAVALALGMKHDEDGRFKHEVHESKFGAENRQTERRYNPETGQWENVDPGGWQTDENGNRSYSSVHGDKPADTLMHDAARDVLSDLGIMPGPGLLGLDPTRSEVGTSTDVLGGAFETDNASGSGSLLGAGSGAYAEINETGFAAGANAEAYLAKGEVAGEFEHGVLSGSGSAGGFVGADARRRRVSMHWVRAPTPRRSWVPGPRRRAS